MKRGNIEVAFKSILHEIEGVDSERQGLQDTPSRVAKAYEEMFAGYGMDPQEILAKRFTEDGCDQYKEMIIETDIPFISFCEHHVLPFKGTVDIGYVSNKELVGLSKLARLVDCYSKRLQVQERMTKQIADAIEKYLKPQGVIVVARAEHFCMCARGIKKSGVITTTSAITGVFRSVPSAKVEFLMLSAEARK